MGIRDKPISTGSLWQNCFAERLIGSIRRECVDQVVALGGSTCAGSCVHMHVTIIRRGPIVSLNKDAPIKRIGRIASHARSSAGCTTNTSEPEFFGTHRREYSPASD